MKSISRIIDETIFFYKYVPFFRTLQEHPMLLQLYRDLVITQVISSEEFWSQHAAEYTQAKKIQRQEIGVNSAFLVIMFSFIKMSDFCSTHKL